MLRAILNKFWRQHPTKHQLYSHLPPITKTIKVGHCWRSRDELISDLLLWTPSYGWAKAARTYIQQLCEDTGCSPEDLPEAMNFREMWRERVRDIRVGGTTWWWWWWWCIFNRTLAWWLNFSLMAQEIWFNARSSHTKDSKNGTWCLLAYQYKVGIKGKVEQSRERSSSLPYTLV